MGRHKIPSEKKKNQGTYRDYRENPDEPMPKNPIGDAPDFLNNEQKEAWVEICYLAPKNVLKDADRIIVEITAMLLAQLREKGLSVGDRSHLINCLARMGMAPSDRAKVSSPDEGKKENSFKQFGGKLEAVK